MSAPKVAVVYHSGYGHTAVVAESVAQGVRDGGGEPIVLKIESAGQDFSEMLDAASEADAIIFGAPTYMGDISAPLKAFFEASSKVWFVQGWKDKLAGGFTNSLSFAGDKAHALNTIFTLSQQHLMIWVGAGQPGGAHSNSDAGENNVNRMGYYIGVATQSDNAPAEVTPPAGDREFARLYGVRMATTAARFK
ncbi:MAG: flavodoxin family protein [Hyphomonadaceae bacterium]|jgi:NAD(P)H dehydrogenase (quinone)|nr:flavodoxin family protein [Hyphomonadaceae bacterium]